MRSPWMSDSEQVRKNSGGCGKDDNSSSPLHTEHSAACPTILAGRIDVQGKQSGSFPAISTSNQVGTHPGNKLEQGSGKAVRLYVPLTSAHTVNKYGQIEKFGRTRKEAIRYIRVDDLIWPTQLAVIENVRVEVDSASPLRLHSLQAISC